MSIVQNVTANWTVLPLAMLSAAKEQARIDHATDDGYITAAIGRVIGALEQRNDVLINPTTYGWIPASSEFCDGRARIPWSPVKTMTANAGGDVSASYAIETRGLHGASPQYLVGAYAAGLVVTCTAGYATAADVPPRMVQRILELTATLYEHREILIDGPAFHLELDATDWMPRL